MPKVTVITPTYNAAEYIAETIESVLGQSLTDLEMIVVDDGSSDGTVAILDSYAARDARLRIIRRSKPSGGPTIPKNSALSLVRSGYVCFLDHDDYFHADKLELMCRGMDQHPDWVAAFHDVQLVSGDKAPHAGTYLSNADFKQAAAAYLTAEGDDCFTCSEDFYIFMSLRYAAIHTVSVIVAPERLLVDPVSFRARFKGSDDTDLWLRLGAQGRIGYIDKVLSYYRIHGNNLSLDTLAMTANAVAVHEDNLLRVRERMNADQLGQYRRKIAAYQGDLAYQFERKGRYRDARAQYRRMLTQGNMTRALRGIAKTTLLQLLKT